jgi:hypothetical protein
MLRVRLAVMSVFKESERKILPGSFPPG